MATAKTETAEKVVSETPHRSKIAVLLPYIIALVAQLPLLLYYFSTLWGRPHYQFFPFALLMVAVFAYLRWPRSYREPFFRRRTSTILFYGGIVFGIAAAMFSEAWFSAASMVMLLTSLLARTKDGEVPGKSLIVLGLPLLIILMPPNNLDFRLITDLQQGSARISSWYLDLLNFKHYSPGTTLNFPDQDYGVERACSGVQSFFTLLFCTAFLVISLRRPWYRAILLLLSTAFWAVFLNSIRILTIPIADIVFDVNLKDGLPHDLLGYSALLIAILMILSTDQLLEFMFGRSSARVDDEKRPGWFESRVLRRSSMEGPRIRNYKPVTSSFVRAGLACSLVVLALGSMQFIDFVRSMNQPSKRIRAFSTDVIIDLDEKALPQVVETKSDEEDANAVTWTWTKTKYDRVDRTRGSDFGQRSDSWLYRSNTGLQPKASLDQTFPGWHELTTCYRNIGWKINPGARIKQSAPLSMADGETVDWSYIECDMVDPTTGQRGYLLFCFSDADGQPFDAPIEWGSLRSFFERAKNRLFHSLRASLFRGEAYQMQVFVWHPVELSQTNKEEIRSQFLKLREDMRLALLRYGDDENLADPADVPDSTNDQD